MMLPYQLLIIVFLFGLAVGSFLNVCIYRIPAGKSVVHPRSMCLRCGNPIPFYDNIPVVSYLWLRGKCRYCATSFSIRYLVVELTTGFAALAVVLVHGIGWPGLVYFGAICVLLVVAFIDLDHQIIPDGITLPGIVLSVPAGMILGLSFKQVFLGIVTGGGILFAVAWGYRTVTGRDGMGGGDIKLMALIGGLIGVKGVVFTIFASSLIGTLVGAVIMMVKGKNLRFAVPFGPFISIGAIVYFFYGSELVSLYFNMVRG